MLELQLAMSAEDSLTIDLDSTGSEWPRSAADDLVERYPKFGGGEETLATWLEGVRDLYAGRVETAAVLFAHGGDFIAPLTTRVFDAPISHDDLAEIISANPGDYVRHDDVTLGSFGAALRVSRLGVDSERNFSEFHWAVVREQGSCVFTLGPTQPMAAEPFIALVEQMLAGSSIRGIDAAEADASGQQLLDTGSSEEDSWPTQ